jgi:hypothetical protein
VDSVPSAGLGFAVVPREKSSLIFRFEFYNAFNHPQSSNHDSNFTSPTFGVISFTTVNARLEPLA